MKKYRILLSLAAVVLLVCGGVWLCRPPRAVETVRLSPTTAAKTVLCPGKVIDSRHIQIFVRESLASTVHVGQTAAVGGAGFLQNSYAGTVTAVSETATVQNGKIGLAATVTLKENETDDSLKPGLSAEARITVKTYERVRVLKSTYLIADSDPPAVFTAENGKVARHTVTLGDRVDGGVIVTAGIDEQPVIIHPDAVAARNRIKETPPYD